MAASTAIERPRTNASPWEHLVADQLAMDMERKSDPSLPLDAYKIVDITIGTSRAASLEVPNLYSIPGGKITEKLLPKAINELDMRRFDGNHKVVYMVGGLPDITQMHRDPDTPRRSFPKYEYEEVIFPTHQNPDEVANRVINDISIAQNHILAEGATPVFATIATQSIATWNFHRLSKNNTSFLLHSDHYDDMQTFLNDTIHIVNCKIVHLNNLINMRTPDLAGFIQKGWDFRDDGPGGRVRNPRYGRLGDGCHLRSETNAKWREHFLQVCSENRTELAFALHQPN